MGQYFELLRIFWIIKRQFLNKFYASVLGIRPITNNDIMGVIKMHSSKLFYFFLNFVLIANGLWNLVHHYPHQSVFSLLPETTAAALILGTKWIIFQKSWKVPRHFESIDCGR